MLKVSITIFAVISYCYAGTYLSIKAPADHPLVSFGNLLQTLLDGSSFAKVEVQTISPNDGHVISVKGGPLVDDADFFETFDNENNNDVPKTPLANSRSTQPGPRSNGVLTAKTNSSEEVFQSVKTRLNEALDLLKRQRTALENKLNATTSQFLNYSKEKSLEESSQITDQFDLAREHINDLESDAKQLSPERTRQELDRFKLELHEWEKNFLSEILQGHIRLREEFSKATRHWRNNVLSENSRLQARIQRDNEKLLQELKRLVGNTVNAH